MLNKLSILLKYNLCDHCLGRQFAQLLHGLTNKERGRALRLVSAMLYDADFIKSVEISNFSGIKLRNKKNVKSKKKCYICHDFFKHINKWVKMILKCKYEFKSFLIGSKLPYELIKREEEIWEKIGIEHCEPLKAEINREIGKIIEKHGYIYDNKNPDIVFILNLRTNRVQTIIQPLFIYGEYKKLRRGIPQTKWPSKKYKTSVEELIAKPIIKIVKGESHKFHGCGREDIDARCLAWRPFVLEIIKPKKRVIKKNIEFPKTVKVRNLRLSDIKEVRKIKSMKPAKTYKVMVYVKDGITRYELDKIKNLKSVIYQRTPKRVLHRRSDKMRKRKVLDIKAKYINKHHFYLYIKADAGLYVKELVTGDEDRTKPNVSHILNKKCIVKELDVIGIHV